MIFTDIAAVHRTFHLINPSCKICWGTPSPRPVSRRGHRDIDTLLGPYGLQPPAHSAVGFRLPLLLGAAAGPSGPGPTRPVANSCPWQARPQAPRLSPKTNQSVSGPLNGT